MNNVSASVVVMSHLSDAEMLTDMKETETTKTRLGFAKYVILQCGGNLTQKINPNKMFDEYLELKK